MGIEINDQAKGSKADAPDFTPYIMADNSAAPVAQRVTDLHEVAFFDPAEEGKKTDKTDDFGDFLNGNLAPEKAKLADHYSEKDVDKGVKAAADNNVPIMLHVGAPWCGPCLKMDKEVWPDIQKEFKGKAAFMGLNGDEVIENKKGGDNAQKLTAEVSGYPTVRLVQPFMDKDGKQQFKIIAESGATDKDGIRKMFKTYDEEMKKAKK